MPSPVSRLATVTVGALLAATSLGCGVISQVRHAAGNVSEIGDVAGKLGDSSKLTFTAEYRLQDGSTATVVQQPPNAAFAGNAGRYIITADSLLMCATSNGTTSCQRSTNETGASLGGEDSTAFMATIAGAGFISTPMAVTLLTAASVAPDAKVEKSTRTIAGQKSTCLKVSNLPRDPGSDGVDAKAYDVCVTGNGVLALFTGTGTDDKTIGVEMTRYQDSADPAAFAAPAGAMVTDVQQLNPGG
jgi:hypothetical protein